MDCCTDPDLLAQLTAKQLELAAVQGAISTVLSGGQSYQLGTGQTTQMVTRASLRTLTDFRETLLQEIHNLQRMCSGGNVTRMAPGW